MNGIIYIKHGAQDRESMMTAAEASSSGCPRAVVAWMGVEGSVNRSHTLNTKLRTPKLSTDKGDPR